MKRLTHERANGIKSGYWSPSKKQDLIDRLAEYEDTGLTPDQILEIDKLYAEKCRHVAELQKAAEHDRWIPVKEMHPESGREVIVTMTDHYGSYTTVDEYEGDCFGWASRAGNGLIAWMPLPEPYRLEEPK